ncbi:MAG TPA: nitroreductase family protein [Trebonia sp.]|jgi:nitroreductase
MGEMNESDARELSMPIGEAMFTQRSIRRMRPDPIPVEHLRVIIAAAVKAPNGGNRQIGRLLVATDRDKIAEFGELYRGSWWAKRKKDRGWNGPEDVPPGDNSVAPMMRLADEMRDVPCVAFVLSERPHQPESVLLAAQNLMLAARALGIGSVPTRLDPGDHGKFRAIFGVPEDIEFHLAIPLGYPQGRFGPTTRLPTAETTHWNQWGGTVPWA